MIIKKIQINGFGNLENKTIEFNNGLNLLYGENESGKSTIINFIKCIFYGINKNKAGNEFSEFERFKPWKDIDFSGKIDYEIDGKTYTAFRDFNRNNCKVYDSNGNDITNTFNKDKTRGVELGMTHLGIDEETFVNTLLINQKEVSVDMQSQKNIVQKLSNILQSGQENISFEKIKTKLQKKVLDEIGTDRSQNKPINLIDREILEKKQQRLNLLNNRDKKDILDESSKGIEEQLKKINSDMEEIKEILEIKEKYSDLLNEKEKTYELTLKVNEKEKQEKISKSKKQFKIFLSIISLFAILTAGILCYYKNYYWIILEIVFVILAIIILKCSNKIDSKDNHVLDFTVIKEEVNKKEQKELDKLIQKGIKETLIERKISELKSLISGLEKKKNDLILDGHKIKIEEGSLRENIDRLSEVEEQLAALEEKKNVLSTRRKVINIAIDKLSEAYEELKQDVIPKMEENIKQSIKETTNNRYEKIYYNNEAGILAENSLGELVPVSKLSIGTIDQFYLGFRFGISKNLGELPIILDECFAYFDDVRLKNILSCLKDTNRQIIIATCSDREKIILDDLAIKYDYFNIKY